MSGKNCINRALKLETGVLEGTNFPFAISCNMNSLGIHGGAIFTRTLTSAGFGFSPNDLATLILHFASLYPGALPTEDEINIVSTTILRMQDRQKSNREAGTNPDNMSFTYTE